MSDFLLALLTIVVVAMAALLAYPAVMSLIWRVLNRLFGGREDLP